MLELREPATGPRRRSAVLPQPSDPNTACQPRKRAPFFGPGHDNGRCGGGTKRLRIGTAVSLAPFYSPLRLAEEGAMLDVPSGGV